MRPLALSVFILLALLGSAGNSYHAEYFKPAHQLVGLGAERMGITQDVVEIRTKRMIESQTFIIMRDPDALAGAQRVGDPKLQRIFQLSAAASGFPADMLAAMCYLESFGNPYAESSAGPKGIMQFSEATGRAAGLKIVHVTRYKTTSEKKQVTLKNGRTVTRTVRHKTPYVVTVRDDRLIPERAIPAAAKYLARMVTKFGGQDWAVFAYHCGEGCVGDMQSLAQAALKTDQPHTVASMFFAASPAYHRELFEAISFHMQRDYSPTYWFRVMRARELLQLYQSSPEDFRKLFVEYRNDADPSHRADQRLVVWLKGEDLLYHNYDDLRRASGKGLVKVFKKPDYFGFALQTYSSDPDLQDLYEQAAPSTVGTLLYIAWETHRLFDGLSSRNEQFVPLRVTELVNTVEQERRREPGSEIPVHCTGQVFDISTEDLPPSERECLNFILDEMGWDGYLGFRLINDGIIHIGCSPSSRDFFTQVYQDALAAKG
ncbi:MAG TPA: transglycosylase SLT domain-containing protein [Bryobacteraceae bacterium]|nr:transglycosylase SLT domain-containing protein [Bryobacteraceae bacterium]